MARPLHAPPELRQTGPVREQASEMVHRQIKPRRPRVPEQAQPSLRASHARPVLRVATLLLLPALAGCATSSGEGPLQFYQQVTAKPFEGREAPPGENNPYRNLSSIPVRPTRGEASVREELTTSLAANRAAIEQPITPGAPVPAAPATEGASLIPATPPPPPRLAAAPPIGSEPTTAELRAGTPDPGQAPAAPPAELTAPAPPSADLLAPAAPPPPRLTP